MLLPPPLHHLQAAALRALGRLALLSESLSQRAVALAEAALGGGTGGGGSNAATEVQAAAVALLADAIEAFPNLYSDRLLLIGRLMTPDAQPPAAQEQPANGPAESGRAGGADSASETAASQQQLEQAGPNGDRHAQQEQQAQQVVTAASASLFPEQREQLARAAAASYCRLLLRNKLKLQGMLGPLGSALAAASPPVAALVQHALRQMLGAAAPKERARLCMALFHQTPPGCRVALAQVRPGASGGGWDRVCKDWKRFTHAWQFAVQRAPGPLDDENQIWVAAESARFLLNFLMPAHPHPTQTRLLWTLPAACCQQQS